MSTRVKTNAKVLFGSRDTALSSHILNVWTTAVFHSGCTRKVPNKKTKQNYSRLLTNFKFLLYG